MDELILKEALNKIVLAYSKEKNIPLWNISLISSNKYSSNG